MTHSLLIAIARIVTRTLTAQRREGKSALKDGFVSWITDSLIGVEWTEKLQQTIDAHDWKRRRQDVMQSLYMTFVSAADRKVFGEYYTPDWLAALIVREALDDAWLSTTIERAESARRRGKRLEGRGVLSCPSPSLSSVRNSSDLVDPESPTVATGCKFRRIRGPRGRRLQRCRAEVVERSFAHMYETGGMPRV